MAVNEDWESSFLMAGPIFTLCITSERIDLVFTWKTSFLISFS